MSKIIGVGECYMVSLPDQKGTRYGVMVLVFSKHVCLAEEG